MVSLSLYSVLALLVWQTLGDDKLRYATWAVLAFFAVRTLLVWRQRTNE